MPSELPFYRSWWGQWWIPSKRIRLKFSNFSAWLSHFIYCQLFSVHLFSKLIRSVLNYLLYCSVWSQWRTSLTFCYRQSSYQMTFPEVWQPWIVTMIIHQCAEIVRLRLRMYKLTSWKYEWKVFWIGLSC